MTTYKKNRRTVLKNLLAGSAIVSTSGALSAFTTLNTNNLALKGNINHSVCRWCYGDIALDDLCKAVKEIGFSAIDLVGPKDWPTLQKYDIYSSMCNGAEISIPDGFNRTEHHSTLIKNYTDIIPLMVKAGYKDVICFSGNRKGMDEETGLKNCAEGLKKLMPLAEKNGITIHMELLNSRVDHGDYMCDKSAWGIELVKHVGSENFKLLYDIYHMQIDEGDVIRTIKNNHQYFGHYHTGGVPGRNEIDESQELFYPAIMKAIVATGFKGYVAQEFIPAAKDKLASLKKAVELCDV
ncbi:TIM barrel protein [Danxiaibacter flavus]|uniref:TIM barrel protein n=1 Tax=Danxiaibacter flavus TaxID=3049108 RepID=A0ABV3ZMP8_9BACT|nr:TIM barrel protein [Chitinophagaceae bacterium DXS]